MNELQTEKKGILDKYSKIIVPFAVFFGACSGAFGSMIEAPALAIGFWRLIIALPFFAVPVFAKKDSRENLKGISRSNWIWCIICGIMLCGHFYCWFTCLKLTSVASAAVLASLHPLVVLLITVFIYKRKVSWKSVLAIIIALCGGVIIMGSNLAALTDGSIAGKLLAFGAAIFMGIYFSIGDKVRKEVDGGVYVFLVFGFCWLSFGAICLITGTPVFGYSASDFFYIFCLAIVCQIGSHAMFNLCIGHVSSLYVSTWEAGDPVFSILIALVLVGQVPSVIEIIGCIIVVCAILFYGRQISHE